MTPKEAFYFALNNPSCDIEKYQEIACKDFNWAYRFARDVLGANIEYCQKYACKYYMWADYFATNICEADIEYCYRLFKILGKDIKRFILNDL